MILLEQQLSFIRFLHSSRSPCLDAFFRFLNYFDTEYFAFIIIPLVWIGFSSKWGIRLFYLIIFSTFLNSFFKILCGLPRPFHLNPSLALVHVNGNGFPSGGAQTAILLGGLLIASWKRPLAWAIGLSYIFLISLSRIYLGVHFPIDVLGGWILGLGILFLYLSLHRKIEKAAQARPLFMLSVGIFLPLLGMVIFPRLRIFSLMISAIAGGIGIYLSSRFQLFLPPPRKIWQGSIRALIGVLGLFFFLMATKLLLPSSYFFLLLQPAILTLWLSLAASPFCRLFPHLKK